MAHIYHHRFQRFHLLKNANTELGELYTTMTLHALAMSLIGIFIPIYLYQLGFSVAEISLFFVCMLLGRALIFNIVAAHLVALYGAKHMMSLSHIVQIVDLGLLVSLQVFPNLWWLVVVSLASGFKSSLYFVPYHIDFSKIEDRKTSGSQISIMSVLVALSSSIGPITGGFIAKYFGITTVFCIAIVVLLFAIRPLLQTREAVQQHLLNWRALKWRHLPRSAIHFGGMGVDHMATLIIWPLFIFLVAFRENPYVGVGAVMSISLALSVVTDFGIGKWIDSGRRLLVKRLAAAMAILTHSLRQLGVTPLRVLGFNIAGEISDAGVVIASTSELYQQVNDHRIEYIAIHESLLNLMQLLVWVTILTASYYVSESQAVVAGFWLTALLMLPLLFKPSRRAFAAPTAYARR